MGSHVDKLWQQLLRAQLAEQHSAAAGHGPDANEFPAFLSGSRDQDTCCNVPAARRPQQTNLHACIVAVSCQKSGLEGDELTASTLHVMR